MYKQSSRLKHDCSGFDESKSGNVDVALLQGVSVCSRVLLTPIQICIRTIR